jgi:hypothetical protein
MGIILAYSIPYINQNLSSVDFLSAHVTRVDGKIPFFDEESRKKDRRRSASVHLKDSWRIEASGTADNTGVVYLSNSKRTSDGSWFVADLLWNGTRPYFISVPVIYSDVVVSAVPGVGQTQFPQLKQWRKYQAPEPAQRGHQTKGMTFYNRYTGHWNYNRKFRRGIRDQIVTSFHDFILLCVENGVRKAVEMMQAEGILIVEIKDVHVRVI